MRTASTLDAGLALAGELARETLPAAERDRALELLVVPNAIRTLPIVTSARPAAMPDGAP
jgi:ABC-type transporter Mla MlaB component